MESDRIKLKPPSLDIAPQMLEAILESQNELSVFLPWVPYALTPEASENNAKEAVEKFEAFNDELRFSVICNVTDRLLGAIGLLIIDKSVPYFEIGYWLRNSEVGKGYVSEAVNLLERYAFVELGAQRIEIKAAEANVRSRAVAERCGYKYEATLVNARRLPSGQLENTVVYSKTRL